MKYLNSLICIVVLSVVGFGQVVKTSSSLPIGSRKVVATAYCMGSRTASGEKVRNGLVAADTRFYPFGTNLLINGSVYRVSDTGGDIKGDNRLDIFMNSCQAARNFGRKFINVTVLGINNPKRNKVDNKG